MRRKFLQLNATTRSPRHQVIELAKDAITAGGGWILDFTLFSNVSICLNFELPVNQVNRLRDALLTTDLWWSESSLQAFEDFAAPSLQEEPPDLRGTLQITFIHDEPDLRIPVPMVPG